MIRNKKKEFMDQSIYVDLTTRRHVGLRTMQVPDNYEFMANNDMHPRVGK